jgi:alpha-glucosidase (family GH31 glycosyl hydrolase)
MRTILFSLCFLISAGLFAQEYNPVANPSATVVSGNARFTVLSPRVIRMEWVSDSKFTDNASLTFVNRNLPVPAFTKEETNGLLEISTSAVKLSYKTGSGQFTENNLSVDFMVNGKSVIWKPGMPNNGNLLGTTRTLDQCNGAPREPLEPGLISRDGWALVDDSQRPLFDNSDWPWVMSRSGSQQQDLYLFVYGSDYKAALKDYTSIAGKIAMPPRFAFGAWWSRYREYTDTEFRALVNDFATHDIPLDVLVIDIDWHIRSLPEFYKNGQMQQDQAGEGYGWTGYTWDKSYFPDPDKFLKWTNDQNLKTCLNLHPASGVQPYEEKYPEMAKAMGIDPATKKYVPFDITDKKFATNYMNVLLHPLEKSGVDFWWLDWQQWGATKIPGVNPTFYLNYVHYSDMERQNKIRPLIFHRWGGLGNHRYQIGFSGDTYVTWKSLNYQPYFTATAANVGFGYWSHDIGGHFGYPDSPELYTRWIQWGIFSPIFRTHCTEDPTIERRIWAYPIENYTAMRNAYLLRYSLVPYIYTEANNTYETGVSTVHPLYYDYPGEENAYTFPNQYMFGRDMMVSPVTRPMGNDSVFLIQKVLLPEGKWYELSSGTINKGGKTIKMPCTIDDIPVFVKEGAIVPMQPKVSRIADTPVNPLILSFFPGEKGSLKLYEDEGNNNNFKKGAFAFTPVRSECIKGNMNITIAPVEGSFPGMLTSRGYELRFPCSFVPKSVSINGGDLSYKANAEPGSWNYIGDEFETRVYLPEFPTNKEVSVKIQFPDDDQQLLSGKKAQVKYMKKFEVFRVDNHNHWDKGRFDASEIVALSQFGQNLEYSPENMKAKTDAFTGRWNNALLVLQSVSLLHKEYKPYYDLLKRFGSIADCPEIKSVTSEMEFDEKASVEIKADGAEKIYYTTDGSVPSRNSKVYSSPFEVSVPANVKAIACPAGNGSCSSVASKVFYKKNTGLNYSLYKGSWSKIPDFSTLVPEKQGHTYDFNLNSITSYTSEYAVVYTGYITIPENGNYTFYLSSDDGSKLYINNQLVIDNDGLHSMDEKRGEIKLAKGLLPIKVEYFQNGGGQELHLEFESKKVARASVDPFYLKTKN